MKDAPMLEVKTSSTTRICCRMVFLLYSKVVIEGGRHLRFVLPSEDTSPEAIFDFVPPPRAPVLHLAGLVCVCLRLLRSPAGKAKSEYE